MMEESGIWARQPYKYYNNNSGIGRIKNTVRYTWTGPIDSQLYSDSLTQLSKYTEQNISILERSRQHTCAGESNNAQKKYAQGSLSLMDFGVVFAPRDIVNSRAQSAILDDDTSSSVSVSAPINHCYLCSTLDQHCNHLMMLHGIKKSKECLKPRLRYTAPRPRVISKLIEEPPASYNNRYKVIVWTGIKPGATTDASVFITIKGDQNVLPKTRLCHGCAKTKAPCLVQGARDVFYVRSPALGNLETLTIGIEQDGQKHCSWYCDKIEVMCLKTSQCWCFVCENWLSLHHGDFKILRELITVNLEKRLQEFELIVTTGSKNLAGTDADVYVTFYGTKGISPKIKLNSHHSGKLFQRKSVDTFLVSFADIGEIRTLRIEHNGKGFASGWFLENVIMKDVKDPNVIYYFLLHGWLAADIGDGQLWREIKAKKILPKEVTTAKLRRRQKVSGKLIKYRVTVHTGDIRYAGTDANVYIIIEGANGKTKKLFMDDDKNSFEKGMTEEFELEAFNTGPLKSIHIGHDNTGPGAGWYCENVIVKKYLSREEQTQCLKRMKKKLQRNYLPDKHGKQRLMGLNNDKDKSVGDSDEDFEQEGYRDVFDVEGRVIKVPICEEYYFECKAWLAKDEGDGLTERELDVKKKSLIFKER